MLHLSNQTKPCQQRQQIHPNIVHIIPNMKYIKFLFLIFSIAVVSEVVSYTSGASPAYTGAISEGNCTSCHSSYSLVTSGNQWNRIRMRSNIPSTGYLPDSTYTITITYAE